MSMLHFELSTRLPAYVSVDDLACAGKKLAQTLKLPGDAVVSVRCVSLLVMAKINKEQRGKPVPTDVLSFAVAEEVQSLTPKKMVRELGDVIICPVYAAREARRRGVDEREEFIRLLVHGVLHIRGYDHATESEEQRMFSLQERLVSAICSLST
jgi:probable rRNA maturation factor